jgi:hypothetical protein
MKKFNRTRYITKYNIELFQIEDKSKRYQHFLVFMIRKFFWYKFNWTFNRIDFMNIWIKKYWYTKNSIEKIFDKGIKNNKFIIKDYIKRWKKYYVLKSNTNKDEHNIIIKIENEIINKITSVNVFYTFCFLVISARPFIYKTKIDVWEFKKVRWRTLKVIWETFNNLKKDNVLYHINRWKELFKPYFNILTRNIPFYNFTIPISSLYFFDGVNYYSDKKHKKWDYVYTNDFSFYLKYISDIELKTKYWIDIEYKKGIKKMNYTFWNELDLWKDFLDDKWKILYNKLYIQNYEKIIEKVISQY